MGQYCFARWRLLSVIVVCRLSSVVVCNTAGGRAGGRAADTPRRASRVPFGRHLCFCCKYVALF